MFQTKLKMVVALLIGFALVSGSASALAYRALAHRPAASQQERGPQPGADRAKAAKEETSDQRAKRLALRVHAQAAAIDKLPRFSYRVRYRHGVVDSMRAVDVSLDRLKQALTAPVREK